MIIKSTNLKSKLWGLILFKICKLNHQKLDCMKVWREVKLNYSKSFHYAFPLIKIPVSVLW